MDYIPESESEPSRGFELVCPQCGNSNQDTVEMTDWYSCYNEDLETVTVQKYHCAVCGHEWTDPEIIPMSVDDAESDIESPSPCEKLGRIAIGILIGLLLLAIAFALVFKANVTLYEDLSFIIRVGPRWW